MVNWSPNTAAVRDNGFGGSRNGNAIIGAIPHHVAGREALDYVANYNTRSSHPTYYVDRAGKQTGIVHPDRRPYSTGNSIDSSVITFEQANERVGGDWYINDETVDTTVDTIYYHYTQSPRFGNGFAFNIPGAVQKQFVIGCHWQYRGNITRLDQYRGEDCPGPYFTSIIPKIIEELNKRALGAFAEGDEEMKHIIAIRNKKTGNTYLVNTITGRSFHIPDEAAYNMYSRLGFAPVDQKQIIDYDDNNFWRVLDTYEKLGFGK